MIKNSCETCKGKIDTVCHQGFPEPLCPKTRLENERLMFGVLLVAAVALLVWTHCC